MYQGMEVLEVREDLGEREINRIVNGRLEISMRHPGKNASEQVHV